MNDIFTIWLWLGFCLFVIFALTLDVFLLNRNFAHPNKSIKVALIWTIIWVSCALIFNIFIWLYVKHYHGVQIGNKIGLDFLAGYIIEKSLSVDNLFTFYVIFHQLRIPLKYQQRVFSYGIWSAIVMRFLFIVFLSYLIMKFHWMLYVLGVFLLLTGFKMLLTSKEEKNLIDSKILRFIKKIFRVTDRIEGESFVVKHERKWYITPLFIALIFIEISDLIFAFDSIPAIFAITTEPFIVWSSNIFAILGLRALYFVLAGMMNRFELLKYGLSLIIIFVGCKMLLNPWYHISVGISLSVIIGTLVFFTLLSQVYANHRIRRGGL